MAAGAMPPRCVVFVSARWRIGAWDVSMPPSSACSQLHSSQVFDT
jgi:hypothetical protein